MRFSLLLSLIFVCAGGIKCNAEDLVGIWRLYNGVDHFYTTDCNEANKAQSEYWPEWQFDELPKIQRNQVGGTVPIFRFFNGTHHFYTTDKNEGINAKANFEGIIGYIYTQPQPPKIILPWYRLYNNKSGDHFYTTNSFFDRDSGDYKFEGIVGYTSYYDSIMCAPVVVHPRSSPTNATGRGWCYCNTQSELLSCHFSAVLTGPNWPDIQRQCSERTHGHGTLIPR